LHFGSFGQMQSAQESHQARRTLVVRREVMSLREKGWPVRLIEILQSAACCPAPPIQLPPIELSTDAEGGRLSGVGADLQGLDKDGLLFQRYDAQPGSVYLLRPDQHVLSRWRCYDHGWLLEAFSRLGALS
jgi:hypothetical protein